MKLAKIIAAIAIGCQVGCIHYRSLLVTSTPSGQEFTIKTSLKVQNEEERMVTPYRLVFSERLDTEDVRKVTVRLGECHKTVVIYDVMEQGAVKEPVLGIPVLLTETQKQAEQEVHFDTSKK